MKIGYSVEGSTDRALIKGLRQRWCPHAELVEGRFRGTTRQSRRREIPKICIELSSKGVELMVFVSDSNDDNPAAWRAVLRREEELVPDEYCHMTVIGICQRNVECWICGDADWLGNQLGVAGNAFCVKEPKNAFESALQISCRDRKEPEISQLIENAPLHRWMQNKSFEDFFDKLWQMSKSLGCRIENLRNRKVRAQD